MSNQPLKSKHIIITRPALQAKVLFDRVTELGGHPICIPTIEIKSIHIDREIQQLKPNINPKDIVIFVSANAVKHSLPLWQSLINLPTLIAIGPGTAAALTAAHLPVSKLPKTYNSEGLLEHSSLQAISDKTIYLCTGKNSRPLIQTTLQQRGARVTPIICYQRQPRDPSPEMIQNLKRQPIDYTIITSLESLVSWHQMIQAFKLNWLLNVQTLVVNPKHKQKALALGFTQVMVSFDATDNSIIQELCKL